MRLSVLLFFLLLSVIAVTAQDVTETPTPTVPDLLGLTPAHAEATLNQVGLRLDPIIVSVPATTNSVNTVIDQSLATGETFTEGAVISVTVARDYNLELVWDTERYGNDLFNILNLTDAPIYFGAIDFINSTTGEISRTDAFPPNLRERQCFQAGALNTVPEVGYFEVPSGCDFVQGAGAIALPNAQDQFWIGTDALDIYQNGIYRDTCQVSAGSCQIWVSDSAYIAEDLTPYTYLIYDSEQLVIYNNSDSQWMDLSALQLADLTMLNDTRTWDTVTVPDLNQLAPHQCVRFATSNTANSVQNCDEIAFVVLDSAFWQEAFTLVDMFGVADDATCPQATGNSTRCIRARTPTTQ